MTMKPRRFLPDSLVAAGACAMLGIAPSDFLMYRATGEPVYRRCSYIGEGTQE